MKKAQIIPLFILGLLLPGQFIHARQTQNNRDATNNRSASSQYFIDEVGLQLAQNPSRVIDSIDPATYILGPNDIITVYAEGLLELTYRGLVVNYSGDVVIPSIGTVNLEKRSLNEAEQLLNKRFSENYKDLELKISLEQPKPVIAFLGGEIQQPGELTLTFGTRYSSILRYLQRIDTPLESPRTSSSITGLDLGRISRISENQDNLESGINEIETLSLEYDFRNIRVKHQDGTQTSIDLIHFFKTGDPKSNPIILTGDKIRISKRNAFTPLISISGAVLSPLEMPYRIDDTIASLLDMVDGTLESANQNHALIIRRIGEKNERLVVPREEYTSYELMANDRIILEYESEELVSASAWVYGLVKTPGNYPIVNGKTTIRDLLEASGGLSN
ncbi:MAG: polysaccharide biosynthesis/export family protein, partial [Bacteroidota bacterium]